MGSRLSEETLAPTAGFPHSRVARAWDTIVRASAPGLVALGLCIATWGLVTALFEVPSADLVADLPGGVVRSVLPGGPAWRDGVRPGQQVVSLTPGESPVEWQIRTRAGQTEYGSNVAKHVAELRESVPLGVAAIALGLLGALALRRWRPQAAALGVLAALCGAVPLGLGGDPPASSLALVLPVGWLAAFGDAPLAVRAAISLAALILAPAWLAARFLVPELFEPVDLLRPLAMLAAAGAMVALAFDLGRLRQPLAVLKVSRAIDLASLAVAAGLVLALWVLEVPPVVLAALVVAGVLLYPGWRRLAGIAVDRLLMSELRARASIMGIEEERRRLARELHDAPLQELSGVIKRLELLPGGLGEAAALREVADHLRHVASELHPPVLEDLGLGAGLAFLADQANAHSAVPVELEVEDRTGLSAAARLPAEVELAVYRIVQEAIANAQQHSGGTKVTVSGLLAPDRLELTVADDGGGISERAVREAQLGGHLGLASMRQRAAAIGAPLEVSPVRPSGTSVRVAWSR